MNENSFRSGFIALIGRPNVGKSTLMNMLVGQKIAITSKKPQTTRGRILTVYTDEEAQLIFLDTPGIHRGKSRLGAYMLKAAQGALDDADLILWLVEPVAFIGAGEQGIIGQLEKSGKPVLLVINKIDTVEKSKLEESIACYQKAMQFADVLAVSARMGRNLDTLLSAIKQRLPYGPPYYDQETVTDQPERDIAAEIIREKALRLLKEEVPHGIAVTVEKMRQRPGKKAITDISATIICERESHKGIIIGKGGAMLRSIGTKARIDIEKMTGTKVNLQIFVKVRKDWRDDQAQLRALGFRSAKDT